MNTVEIKNFDTPDEVRDLPKTNINVINFHDVGITVMKAVFQPGWKWSECVKPKAHTDACEMPHIMLMLSGCLMIRMNDGTETKLHASDVVYIPPGHDAWVVGDEPCVFVDFTAGKFYGTSS